MRYYIIFGITIVIVALLIFYPSKYLHIYKDQVTINYEVLEETDNELWTYDISNDNLVLDKQSNKKWTFKANKNGEVSIYFYYDKKDDTERYMIEYKFKVKGNKIYWTYGNASGLLDFPNPE